MNEQMRTEVADSWHRSVAAGVEREDVEAPITLDTSTLREHRAAHPLARVFPLLDDVLGQAARDCNALMAVSDEAGQLLWVCGTSGLALRLDKPISVVRSEHFRQSVKDWSCAAIPIHEPGSSRLLGVLDITGGDEIVVPQTLALVRAAARLAEAELARELPPEVAPAAGIGMQVSLESLGRRESLISISDGRGRQAKFRLSPRHSEIVLLLAAAPRGLSGDEMMVLLYEEDPAPATLRAELKRLRDLLGDELLRSRPYRLDASVSGDWLDVEGRLASGDLRGAMQRYLMSAWTRSSWGQDDYEMWLAQRECASPASPLLPLINGQIARLDREFS